MIKQYIYGTQKRGSNLQRIGLLNSYKEGNVVKVGISLCHPTDTFCSKLANDVCLISTECIGVQNIKNRKTQPLSFRDFELESTVKEDFMFFVERCIRYYKECSIIIPAIRWAE